MNIKKPQKMRINGGHTEEAGAEVEAEVEAEAEVEKRIKIEGEAEVGAAI